jgi:hypothetical protein
VTEVLIDNQSGDIDLHHVIVRHGEVDDRRIISGVGGIND